eukprot:scaffold24038_cov121-Isochrysis_galbana.AAC.2
MPCWPRIHRGDAAVERACVGQAAQEENALKTALKSNTTIVFKVGDRVCRRILNHTNKLEFFYSGPYRVQKVISDSRYKLYGTWKIAWSRMKFISRIYGRIIRSRMKMPSQKTSTSSKNCCNAEEAVPKSNI